MNCLQNLFNRNNHKSKNDHSLIETNSSDITSDSTTLENEKTSDELLEELSKLTLVGYSKAIETKDTALHVACEYNYSDDLIINVLLKADADGAHKENGNGDLPLHSAMKAATDNSGDEERSGVSKRVLEALLSKNKGAAEHLNHNDCLPIHFACDKGVTNEFVIKSLLALYPDSVMIHSKLTKPFEMTKERADEIEDEIKEEISTHCNNTGLYSYFIDSIDNLKGQFLKPTSNSKEHIDEDDGIETDLTPLHLAVLNNASPDIIGSLLNANSFCLNLRTSKGRTAMDIAKATPGAEGSIEVMQSYEKNVSMLLSLKVVSKGLIDASAEDILKGNFKLNEAGSEEEVKEKKDPRMLWKKAITAVKFLNRLNLSLGPANEMDCDEAMKAPPSYEPPANLDMVCVDITLPVGFRQLRWGLTNSKSTFCKDFHVGKMNYSELDIGAWDKFDNKIGIVKGNAPMDEQKFIGAKREINYLMPASLMVKANTAYTTETILEYTNYSLVIQRVAKNPDVPYGKTFECRCLDVFINTGHNTVRMITSTQAVFYESPPFIAWKIKDGMKNGVTEKSIALGESICDIRAQSIQLSESERGQ